MNYKGIYKYEQNNKSSHATTGDFKIRAGGVFERRKWTELEFRVNRLSSYTEVQTLNMCVKLLYSFELPFVAKAIMGRIRREGLRWKRSQFFMF